jgi:thiol-disulfide isomerase/thioredoxin
VGLTTQVRTELPAVNEAGTYDLVTKIVKVNGEANTYAAEESVTKVYALDVVPKHRAVVEEYTGTWCGYCPRGFVGLEKMASLYPEDFIALSYHNGDPMECFSRIDYPSVIDGFPFAWLDRVKETDAYCGDGAYGTWGIEQTWLDRCNVFAPADIEVTATWANRNMTAISVEATAKFAIDVEESPYLLSYALVANGLTGNTSDWLQSNYYAGELGWPEDMDIFVNGENYVEGLVFNDVIVARSDVNGKEESLPTTIQRGVAYTDAYRFATMNAKNLNGETVIQDKNNLVVVALLINKQTGEIVNANKTIVSQSTGISNVNGEGETVRTVYHDMMGRRVLVPQNGIYLKSTYTKDGQVKTKKVSLK